MTPANVLGLGWACTPAGLKAMEELAKLEAERGNEGYLQEGAEGIVSESARGMDRGIDGRKGAAIGEKSKMPKSPVRIASNEMCTFLILNISSLQLIPVNMIAYRAQYGSADPARIIAPSILATAVSTLAAVVFCKVMDR